MFDGIASPGLTPEYRAGPAWAHLNATIASARDAYGSDHYDAAFQTGAAMTYDQAVEHSLRVLDDLVVEIDGTQTT